MGGCARVGNGRFQWNSSSLCKNHALVFFVRNLRPCITVILLAVSLDICLRCKDDAYKKLFDFDFIDCISIRDTQSKYDVMHAYDFENINENINKESPTQDGFIFLGHWNDGVK